MNTKNHQAVNDINSTNTGNATNSTTSEPNTIGKRIKMLRNKKGYTQERVGEEVYVNKATVCRWEKGEKIPDSDMVTKLANLFGVTPFFLCHGRHIDTTDNLLDLNGLTFYQIDLLKRLADQFRNGC